MTDRYFNPCNQCKLNSEKTIWGNYKIEAQQKEINNLINRVSNLHSQLRNKQDTINNLPIVLEAKYQQENVELRKALELAVEDNGYFQNLIIEETSGGEYQKATVEYYLDEARKEVK